MTGYCDTDKARRDAEWLAGSERDDAERNLARAYLEIQRERDSLRDRLEQEATR